MFFVTVLQHYLVWHYGMALVLYLRIYRNLSWFVLSFFSVASLSLSFFAPFRRITETRTRTFDLGAWASAFVINLLSRILGACIRLIIIMMGLTTLSLLTVVSLVGYAFWLAAPIVAFAAIVSGGYVVLTSLI